MTQPTYCGSCRYAILEPPVRWTEDERPAPTVVIQSTDGGESWRAFASCDDGNDAEEVCDALQARADARAAERAEEHRRLEAELAEERERERHDESDHW